MKRTSTGSTLSLVRALLITGTVCAAPVIAANPAVSARPANNPPALTITNDPLPPGLQDRVYSKPSRAPVVNPSDVMNQGYYDNKGETAVGRKIDNLRSELFDLQGKVSRLSESLSSIESRGQNQAASYYAAVATISTQLQSGTTPGNPRLTEKLSVARQTLEDLGGNIASLTDLSMQISSASSTSSYLLESVRATYSLSGAVEEDHARLAQMEDSINNTNVVIDRMLNNVNDDITRTTAYLNTERDNLRTLSLAIATGNMFGKSLSNRPFASAQLASFSPNAPAPSAMGGDMGMTPVPVAPVSRATVNGPRPLVKIRFDRPNVDYEQPVYMAVNEALRRYPDARFELVAVHPSKGNAAQVAIESTKARRDAEKVLRSLTEMGLDLDRIDLSYTPSAEAASSEVDLYVR